MLLGENGKLGFKQICVQQVSSIVLSVRLRCIKSILSTPPTLYSSRRAHHFCCNARRRSEPKLTLPPSLVRPGIPRRYFRCGTLVGLRHRYRSEEDDYSLRRGWNGSA